MSLNSKHSVMDFFLTLSESFDAGDTVVLSSVAFAGGWVKRRQFHDYAMKKIQVWEIQSGPYLDREDTVSHGSCSERIKIE